MGTIALLIWPLIGGIFFRILSLPAAVCATFFGGYLLLPTKFQFDMPLIPALDKHTIPALTVLGFVWFLTRPPVGPLAKPAPPSMPGWIPRNKMILLLLGFLLFGSFGTALTNGDPKSYGITYLPGLRPYDGLSEVLQLVFMLIPFFIARKVLATPDAQKTLLFVLVVAAFAHSFLALYEIRMSPQLNRMVYGFFPHSWLQHVRGGGFRPLVFLNHGLWLAIFNSVAVLAAFGLMRGESTKKKYLFLFFGVWLLMTLLMSRALGALIITMMLLPIVLFMPRRLQVMTAASLAILILMFPVLRAAGVIPVDGIVSIAESIDTNRAGSLQFRLENEDILLEKANSRALFGWGGWGRNRVYDEAGRDISITDGGWIIHIGFGGWIRYLGIFGLMGWGIIALLFRKPPDRIALTLAVMMAANLVDLIPNNGVSPLTWLMTGALCGRLEKGTQTNAADAPQESLDPSPRSSGSVYARSFASTKARTSEGPRMLRMMEERPKQGQAALPYRRSFDQSKRRRT